MSGYFRRGPRRASIGLVSGKTPGDKKEPVVEATLDDLRPVDTNPVLKPISAATITLDEEPAPAPSATQLLDPVEDAPTDPRRRIPTAVATPQLLGESRDTTPRKRVSIKSDAFESSPALGGAPQRHEVVPRGPPPAWQRAEVWTPGLIVLGILGVLLLLVALFVLLQRLG